MAFPKYSYDLLVALNEEIPVPHWPTSATSAVGLTDEVIRKGIWFAAQRALVDSLIDQMMEEEADGKADREELRPSSAFGRVLPADLKVREVSVGNDEQVDGDPLVEVHHLPGA